MMLVQWCSPLLPFRTAPSSQRIPKFKSTASAKTTVEWPKEKKYPTLSGRLPSWINFRVVLSMAAM